MGGGVALTVTNAGTGDAFGHFVTLSGDANTLAVGAPNERSTATGLNGDAADDTLTTGAGAAYLFTRDAAGTWTQKTYIKAPNTGEGDLFGNVLALSDDGQTLVVGAEEEDGIATGTCATADAVCTDTITGQGNNDAPEAGAVYLY